jgi:hypothetical protein
MSRFKNKVVLDVYVFAETTAIMVYCRPDPTFRYLISLQPATLRALAVSVHQHLLLPGVVAEDSESDSQ